MIIPKKIKIGGHSFSIVIGKPANCVGEMDRTNSTITIGKLEKTQMESTLFHEIFHAMNSEMDGTHVGHMLLDSLAEQIYQVLSDNKMLK